MPTGDGAPALLALRFWLGVWQTTVAQSALNMARQTALWDARRLRGAWLRELARSTDRYMRSTQFLSLMQCGLSATTRAARLFSPFGTG